MGRIIGEQEEEEQEKEGEWWPENFISNGRCRCRGNTNTYGKSAKGDGQKYALRLNIFLLGYILAFHKANIHSYCVLSYDSECIEGFNNEVKAKIFCRTPCMLALASRNP